MKVVFLHTDFRIYWPARLKAVMEYLNAKGILLEVVEIAGAGSPYYFAHRDPELIQHWHCLFPDKKMEDLAGSNVIKLIVSKLDELNPDIVFTGPIAFTSGAAALRWGLINKKKIIVFDDARLEDVPRSPLINFVKRKVYSGADAIFCPAPDWAGTFRYFGFSREQIFFGVNVVDNGFWRNPPGDSPEDVPEVKYFLAAGRQVRKKNFLFLLKAYLNYKNTTANPFHLMIIGAGPDNSDLKAFVEQNNMQEMVLFYPFMSQEDLRTYYHHAACFVLPSTYKESWGLVVNEAMASGLPVLVSNQAGCSSTLVKEGVNGFTFSPDDVDGLADLLSRVSLMNQEKRMDMGIRSLEIISEWGLERFCRGVDEALIFVVTRNKKSPDLLGKLFIRLWKGRYRPT